MRVSQVIYENLDSNIGENEKTVVTGSLIKNGKAKQDGYLLSDKKVNFAQFNFNKSTFWWFLFQAIIENVINNF